jgi:hypothetical protein
LAFFHQKLPENEGEIIGFEEPFTFWLDELPVPFLAF